MLRVVRSVGWWLASLGSVDLEIGEDVSIRSATIGLTGEIRRMYKCHKIDDRERALLGDFLSKIERSQCSKCVYYRDS